MLSAGQESNPPDRSLFAAHSGYITLLYTIQIAAISTGLAAIRLSPWLARGILAAAIAAAIASAFLQFRQGEGTPRAQTPRRVRILSLAFLAIALFTYLILWATAYIAPDLSVDGNSYHIPTLSLWDSRGYIHWIKTSYLEPLLNGYPKGMEAVSYIVAKGLNSQFINTTNLIFLPLGFLGIARTPAIQRFLAALDAPEDPEAPGA